MTDAAFTFSIGRGVTLQLGRCGIELGLGFYAWAGRRDAFLGKLGGHWEMILGDRTVWTSGA